MSLPSGTRSRGMATRASGSTTPGGRTIILDPWFGNPNSPIAADAVDRCDLLLVTHGHFDHFGDALSIGEPPATRVAVHPRAEPVAAAPPAGR